MFPSPKSTIRTNVNNGYLHKTINDSYNEPPKITSTPLHPLPTRKHGIPFSASSKPRLLSLRRYSLSDVSSLTHDTSQSKNHSPGPLLASINYKDNISTYEETKSSGLAGRVVQYSEETARKKPLCQEKYDSPGLFPIVHLFNKKTEQLPKPVFIKIGTPDPVRRLPPEHSKKILESITKPVGSNLNSSLNGISHSQNGSRTENVLDALKEISRKRIHANEDFELHEDHGKKQRTDDIISSKSSKRPQDNLSPDQSLNSSCKPVVKKICVYDEYAASRSSTNFPILKKNSQQSGTKRKTISTSTDNPTFKQTKLVNAETQTEQSKENDSDKDKNSKTGSKENGAQIFDENPLENNRKHRLAALMGTIVGKQVEATPESETEDKIKENSPEKKEVLDTDVNKEKHLTSILSDPNKPHVLVHKHVHFSISEDTSKADNPAASALSNKAKETPDTPPATTSNVAVTESSLVPLPSFSVAPPKPDVSLPSTVTTSSPVKSSSIISTPSTSKPGGFKFNLTQPTISNSQNQSPIKFTPLKNDSSNSNPLNKSQTSSGLVAFASAAIPTTTSKAFSSATTTTTSSASFTPPVTTSVTPAIKLDFSTTSKSTAVPHFNASTPILKNSSSTAPTIQSFTSLTSTLCTTNAVFGGFTVTTSVPSSSVVTSTFVFGSNPITTPSFGNSNDFGSNVTEKPSTNTSTTPATTTSAAVFESVPISMPSFLTSTLPVNTSTPMFGTKSVTSTTKSNVPTPLFGSVTTSAPSVFAPTSSSFGIANTVPSFGTSSSAPFGNSSIVPSFNAPTSVTSSTFGSFATPTAPSFGSTLNAVSPFEKTTTAGLSFGNDNITTTNAPFGNPTNSSFGSNVTFTTQSIFGSSTKSSFSIPSAGQTTTSSSVFGGTAAPTFNFGSKTDNPFGSPKPTESMSTSSSNLFLTTTPNFGISSSAPSFSQNTGSVLGSKPVAFGAQPSAFGNSADNTPGSVFQTGNASSSFAKPEVTQSGFGASTNTFGSAPTSNMFNSQPNAANSGLFTFGQNHSQPASGNAQQNTPNSGGAFTFGSNQSQSTPGNAFNFGSSNALEKSKSFNFAGASTPSFGSNSAPSFQSGPSFGTPTPSFGAVAPTAGIFNIGSGSSSTGRARTQLKARRRT